MPLGDTVKHWVPVRIFKAGTMPAYSNYATALAGYIVERVSGKPFDDYLDQHIFGRSAWSTPRSASRCRSR